MPRGTSGWSTEVSLVARESLTEEIRKNTKLVMPEEQIPPAKMPLTQKAAQSSPLVAVSSKLVPKLVEAGVRVHTVGVDSVTSSFYYIGEGGGEERVQVEGDLVAAVGAMLGDRAETSAIERVLDGLTDRLLRSLSRDRVSEIGVELAAQLPRAAADGTGTQGTDLDAFEKQLSQLIGASEKYSSSAKEIADNIAGTYERKVNVPLFGEARKLSMGPFDLTVGEKKVPLPTYERWVMSGPLQDTTKAGSVPPPGKPLPSAPPRPASVPPPAMKAEDAQRAAEVAAAAAAKKKADEEAAAAKKRADEEAAAAKKKAEEEAAAAKKKAEEEAAAAKKKAEEEEAAAKKKKAEEEEAAAKKKAEEEEAAAKKKAEEEEAAAKKKAEEEGAAAKKKKAEAEEEDEEKKPAEKKKKADDKKEPKQSEVSTLKVRRAESDRSSSIMTYAAIALLLAAVYLAYRVWFSH